MARVKLVEPATGAVIEVDSDSPLTSVWKKADEPKKAPAKKATPSKSKK